MSRLALLLLASMPGGPAALPAPSPEYRRRERQAREPRGPLSRPCPRCGAAPSEGCDRRTLGRHAFHFARLEVPRG